MALCDNVERGIQLNFLTNSCAVMFPFSTITLAGAAGKLIQSDCTYMSLEIITVSLTASTDLHIISS